MENSEFGDASGLCLMPERQPWAALADGPREQNAARGGRKVKHGARWLVLRDGNGRTGAELLLMERLPWTEPRAYMSFLSYSQPRAAEDIIPIRRCGDRGSKSVWPKVTQLVIG